MVDTSWTYACPSCDSAIVDSPRWLGHSTPCVLCGGRLELLDPADAPESAPPPAAPLFEATRAKPLQRIHKNKEKISWGSSEKHPKYRFECPGCSRSWYSASPASTCDSCGRQYLPQTHSDAPSKPNRDPIPEQLGLLMELEHHVS